MKIGIIADAPLITHSCAVVGSQLAKQFVKMGHEVFYLGYNYTGEKYSHADGYDIYPDTFPPTRKQSVADFIKATGVEILYAHGSKDIFAEGMEAAKEAGIPYLPHTFYSTPYKNDKVNTFEARKGFILYDCDKVDDMAVCNNFSVGVGFAMGKRTWFVPNGVDTEIFYPDRKARLMSHTPETNYREKLGIPEDDFVFLFSGSNISGKDPGRCLEAFKVFKERNPNANETWLVMHTRPNNSHLNLRKIAEDKGIDDRVRFVTDANPAWLEQPEADKKYRKGKFSPPYTTTPYEDMPKVFRTGDVLLAPTLMEGMSTTILEAMACGLPVICSDDAVVSEPVVPFSTGMLCRRHLTNENLVDDMVKHMEFYITSPSDLNIHSDNAENLIKIKYSWEVVADQLVYIFNLLIHKYYG